MRRPAYSAFGLTLVVNHACNLRCTYCYTGAKVHSPMPPALGEQAIRRALASLEPGGTLQIGFFGGEPLLEADAILGWMNFARESARQAGKTVRFNLTTNGTLATDAASAVLQTPDLDLAISCDGAAPTHDRHRRDAHGRGTSHTVETSLRDLIRAARAFSVVMVVRPDSLAELSANLAHLRALGVARFTLSPDVWTPWSDSDLAALSQAVEQAADLWRAWLPAVSINWFDAAIARLARLDTGGVDTRCAFGDGEIAVAPSGRLYPCERLVGEDEPRHPLRLPGHADDGDDFLNVTPLCSVRQAPCTAATACACSNYVRSGSIAHEDALLRILHESIDRALRRIIHETVPTSSPVS